MRGRGWVVGLAPAALTPVLAASAAALGALYAISAYRVAPSTFPLVLVGLLSLAIGLWRVEYGLAGLILVTPFSENAPIADPGAAKLRVALILWAIVLVLVQSARAFVNGQRLYVPALLTASALYLGAALIAVPLAPKVGSAASKFLLLTGSVAIFLLIASSLADWRRLRPILLAALAAGLAIACHTIYQYVTGQVSRIGFVGAGGIVEYRVTSFFQHPNQLAGYLALFVPLGFALFRAFESATLRALCLLVGGLSAIAVVLTYSRGGLVSLAALAILYFGRKAAGPAIVVGLIALALTAPSTFRDRIANAQKTNSPEVATRLDFWQTAIGIFDEHPLNGAGLNNFGNAYAALQRSGKTFLGTGNGKFIAPESAHNLYLNTLAEQGLIGAAALAVLIAAIGRLAFTLRRSVDPHARSFGHALIGIGLVLLIHNAFDVTFVDPKTSTLIWALLGVGAALRARDLHSALPGPAPP